MRRQCAGAVSTPHGVQSRAPFSEQAAVAGVHAAASETGGLDAAQLRSGVHAVHAVRVQRTQHCNELPAAASCGALKHGPSDPQSQHCDLSTTQPIAASWSDAQLADGSATPTPATQLAVLQQVQRGTQNPVQAHPASCADTSDTSRGPPLWRSHTERCQPGAAAEWLCEADGLVSVGATAQSEHSSDASFRQAELGEHAPVLSSLEALHSVTASTQTATTSVAQAATQSDAGNTLATVATQTDTSPSTFVCAAVQTDPSDGSCAAATQTQQLPKAHATTQSEHASSTDVDIQAGQPRGSSCTQTTSVDTAAASSQTMGEGCTEASVQTVAVIQATVCAQTDAAASACTQTCSCESAHAAVQTDGSRRSEGATQTERQDWLDARAPVANATTAGVALASTSANAATQAEAVTPVQLVIQVHEHPAAASAHRDSSHAASDSAPPAQLPGADRPFGSAGHLADPVQPAARFSLPRSAASSLSGVSEVPACLTLPRCNSSEEITVHCNDTFDLNLSDAEDGIWDDALDGSQRAIAHADETDRAGESAASHALSSGSAMREQHQYTTSSSGAESTSAEDSQQKDSRVDGSEMDSEGADWQGAHPQTLASAEDVFDAHKPVDIEFLVPATIRGVEQRLGWLSNVDPEMSFNLAKMPAMPTKSTAMPHSRLSPAPAPHQANTSQSGRAGAYEMMADVASGSGSKRSDSTIGSLLQPGTDQLGCGSSRVGGLEADTDALKTRVGEAQSSKRPDQASSKGLSGLRVLGKVFGKDKR